MKVEQNIELNNGIFTVVWLSDDKSEIRIQRTTEPKIKVWGFHKEDTQEILLIGWKKYHKYQII